MLAALQAGSRGTQACINAASTVSGIIGDLDTTIMFATAGTLHAENENESFADHRENILKTAKALVEDTKTLVAGTEQLRQHFEFVGCNFLNIWSVITSNLAPCSLLVKYTGCNRRNGPDFGRVFLRSNYTDITQNTYIQS